MRVRRGWPLIVALVLLQRGFAYSAERVVLGYSGVGSGEEVHHLAKQLGLFKKNDLDVEIVYIPGGSTVVQSMVAGDVHFGRGSSNGGRERPTSPDFR